MPINGIVESRRTASCGVPEISRQCSIPSGCHDFFSLPKATKLIDKAPIPMVDKLITNLSSSSHDISSHSLRCLELLHIAKSHRKQVPSVISTAQIIGNAPLEISNARNISLYVRRLAGEHSSVAKGSWESRIAPDFCFGLLTVHFSPVKR